MTGFSGTTAGIGAYLSSTAAYTDLLSKSAAAASYLGSIGATGYLTSAQANTAYMSIGLLETTAGTKTYDVSAGGILAAVADATLQAANEANKTAKLSAPGTDGTVNLSGTWLIIPTRRSINAAGTGQADAMAITGSNTSVDGGSGGIRLLESAQDTLVFVRNGLAGDLNVYPPSGDTIAGLAANAPQVLATQKCAFFLRYNSAYWLVLLGA